MRTSLFLVLTGQAYSCSLMPPNGIAITDIDQSHSQGSIGSDRVRLQLSDYDANSHEVVESQQVILDFATGSLEADDDTLEWFPTLTGYAPNAAGNVVAGSGVNATWNNGSSQSAFFALPNMTSFAHLWYSSSLDHVFIVFQTSSSFEHQVAACRPDGTCLLSLTSFQGGYLSPSQPAQVWDSEGIVELPLACCVCVTAEYYTFELTADGHPSLTSILPLSTLGPVWYDVAANEVWASPLRYTGHEGAALLIERYNYASHTTSSVELPAGQVEAFFSGSGDGGSQMPGWAIAIIAVGTVGLVATLIAVTWRVTHGRAQCDMGKPSMTPMVFPPFNAHTATKQQQQT